MARGRAIPHASCVTIDDALEVKIVTHTRARKYWLRYFVMIVCFIFAAVGWQQTIIPAQRSPIEDIAAELVQRLMEKSPEVFEVARREARKVRIGIPLFECCDPGLAQAYTNKLGIALIKHKPKHEVKHEGHKVRHEEVVLVEREKLDKIIAELRLSFRDLYDREKAKEVGRKAGRS